MIFIQRNIYNIHFLLFICEICQEENLDYKIRLKQSEVRCIYLFVFVLIVMLLSYRWSTRIGFVVLGLEIIGIILCLSSYDHSAAFKGPFLTFFLFALAEVMSGMLHNGVQSVKKPFYLEVVLCIYFFFLIDKETLGKIIYALRNIGVILSLFGCIEFALKDSFFIRLIGVSTKVMSTESIGTTRFRVRTIFLQPMPCATIEVFFWILLIFFPYRNRLFNALGKGLIFVCLIGTQTRSSWLAFIFINLVIYLEKSTTTIRIQRNFIRLLPLLAILFVIVCVLNIETIKSISELVSKRWLEGTDVNSATFYNRFTQVRRSVSIWNNGTVIDKLFGKGHGYLLGYLRMHPIRGFTVAVDMQFAAILVDCGLLGVLLIFLVFVQSGIAYFSGTDLMSKACAAGVINILISGFFYEILGWASIMIVLVICLRGLTFDQTSFKNAVNEK